ncbi:hypothetical protein F8S20_23055 [Nostoc sp. BAE]|nr:hypothetical protein [Nostoc commune BAE]
MSTGKGKKRVRNVPVLHDEPKKRRGVWLTDTAWHSIQEYAANHGISASECLEELIRKQNLTVVKTT